MIVGLARATVELLRGSRALLDRLFGGERPINARGRHDEIVAMRKFGDVGDVVGDAPYVGDFRQNASAVAAVRGDVEAARPGRRLVASFPPHPPGEPLNWKGLQLLIAVAGPRADFFPDFRRRLIGVALVSAADGKVFTADAENDERHEQQKRTFPTHRDAFYWLWAFGFEQSQSLEPRA